MIGLPSATLFSYNSWPNSVLGCTSAKLLLNWLYRMCRAQIKRRVYHFNFNMLFIYIYTTWHFHIFHYLIIMEFICFFILYTLILPHQNMWDAHRQVQHVVFTFQDQVAIHWFGRQRHAKIYRNCSSKSIRLSFLRDWRFRKKYHSCLSHFSYALGRHDFLILKLAGEKLLHLALVLLCM